MIVLRRSTKVGTGWKSTAINSCKNSNSVVGRLRHRLRLLLLLLLLLEVTTTNPTVKPTTIVCNSKYIDERNMDTEITVTATIIIITVTAINDIVMAIKVAHDESELLIHP